LKNPFKTLISRVKIIDEQTNKQLLKSENKQSSKSERKTCLVCNVTVDETEGIRWKRVWLGEIASIDSKVMNNSMPISLNHFMK